MMKKTRNTNSNRKMPFLTTIVLSPVWTIYDKCSKQTQKNMHTISIVLSYTIFICGGVLGISLSTFCFAGHPLSYLFTIPIGIGLYWLIDRLVVMADAHNNATFINVSRIVIATVFCTFNSLLVHTAFFADDIQAEMAKEIVIEQNTIQVEADSAMFVIQEHKEELYDAISEEAEKLHKRNDDLVAEAEGLSPSGHIGMGPVYEAKKEAFSRDSLEFERVRGVMMAEAAKDDSAIVALEQATEEKKANAHHQVSTGFNHTVELLHRVVMRSPLNMFIAVLFFVLCMILELLPFLAKHYLDITEYFEHGKAHVQAYVANRDLHKEHTTAEVKHESTARHKYRMRVITNRFTIATLKQKTQHSENIIVVMGEHFAVMVEQEEKMSVCYPEHFDTHIQPVFNEAYARFGDNHKQAFQPETGTVREPLNV